jgi:dephospho-CoA kinase
MNKLICVVGMAGAGKSLVSDDLVKQGFAFLRFGQITLDKVKERGLEINEANEKKVREEIRKEFGMGAFATLNISKIDELLAKFNVVVDGLYSWTEYKILREEYREKMIVIAVFAPPELRYERLENRVVKGDEQSRFRAYNKEDARARDFAEIENIEKGGPIAMADFTILNTGSKEEVAKEVKRILSQIK